MHLHLFFYYNKEKPNNRTEHFEISITTLHDDEEDDELLLSLELPHAARVNKARTETDAKVNLEKTLIIISLFD